jgi:dUTPase
MKPDEHLPVLFESVGNIGPRYTGRIKVTLTNYSSKGIKMSEGDIVGYIVLQSFSLK